VIESGLIASALAPRLEPIVGGRHRASKMPSVPDKMCAQSGDPDLG